MNTNRGNPIFKLLNDRLDEYVNKKPLEWKEWYDQYGLTIRRYSKNHKEYLSIRTEKLKNTMVNPVIPISIRNCYSDHKFTTEIEIDNGYSSIKYINSPTGLNNSDYVLYRWYSQGWKPNHLLPETISYNIIRRMLFEIFGIVSHDINKMTILSNLYWVS